MRKETVKKIGVWAVALIIPLAVGGLSALLTKDDMDLYKEIVKPPLSPPSVVFPIVWTALYILMGVSSAIVVIDWRRDGAAADRGISFYAVSLAFNFVWSILFFAKRLFLFSFIWLLVLLLLIILTITQYKKVSGPAAYLQIPYALWAGFAGYLNFAVWILNK